MRKGEQFDSWDDARAVFATPTGLVVRNVLRWFEDCEREKGLPPIVHTIALSSIAWLKNPSAATALKLHELVALCAVALKPPPAIWRAFLRHLDDMERTGRVASDEVIAILAAPMTERLLSDIPAEEIDSESVTEIVERVKATYRTKAEEMVREADSRAISEVEQRRSLELRIGGRVRAIANVAAWVIFVAAILVTTYVFVFGLPRVFGGGGLTSVVMGSVWVGGLILFQLSTIRGLTLLDLRSLTKRVIAKGLDDWLLADHNAANDGATGAHDQKSAPVSE